MSSTIEKMVQQKYGEVAKSALSTADAGVRAVAQAFGYSAEELSSIPAEANMGLSCGNPTATASIKPGETVVDLGSGGGLDVFLASKKVGSTGKAIGIDMTPEMVARSQKSAADRGYTNVEFHMAPIDAIPLASASADCIISNCVINLASDKPSVFREMFRILKPGGRVAVSDIVLKKALPADLAQDLMAYIGCIAGAISIDDFRKGLLAAGFSHVHIVDTASDLNAYGKVEGQSGCCSPPMTQSAPKSPVTKKSSLPIAEDSCCGPSCCGDTKSTETVHEGLASVIGRYDLNEFASSVKVYAVKSAGSI